MKAERLDKLLAAQSTGSRKDARELVKMGRVRVNGAVEKAADAKVTPGVDAVEVDGCPMTLQKHAYLMLDKPQGVVSATRDPRQSTVVDLVPPELRRDGLFPAGRLDKDTTGFVLLTDDGDFAHKILSPKNHIAKTYVAQLDLPVDESILRQFEQGFALDGGDTCRPARLTVLETGERELVRVVLTEGMYHQIKRMFAKCGRTVIALRRIKMGGLALDPTLGPGGCRAVTPEELKLLAMGAREDGGGEHL